MGFLEQIIERAKSDIKTIVLPESTDLRVVTAASMISKQGIANVVLVGDESEIKKLAGDLDLSKVKIENPQNSANFENFVTAFYELRKSKGMTIEEARKQ